MRIFYFIFIAGLLSVKPGFSQEHHKSSPNLHQDHHETSADTEVPHSMRNEVQEHNSAPAHGSEKGMFRFTLSMGHAHTKKAISKDHGSDISSAAWAFDADYWISDHFAVGLHNDIILENFVIEEHLGNNEYAFLEREYPIAVVPVLLYKPWHHLVVLAGAGPEFSKEKNLMVIRSGLEYGWKLTNAWELGVTTNYDFKRSHDTWMLGFGISKFIGFHRQEHKGR